MTVQLTRETAGVDCFLIEGTVDVTREAEFRELPRRVAAPRVRFDFQGAGRINSMGVALLLRCFKDIRDQKGAEITLAGLSPMHAMLFKMTGIFLLCSQETEGRVQGEVA